MVQSSALIETRLTLQDSKRGDSDAIEMIRTKILSIKIVGL